MNDRPNWPRCSKCKSANTLITEMWSKHAISWQPGEYPDDGYQEPGKATGVYVTCLDCNHERKLRGVTQIDEKWWEETE